MPKLEKDQSYKTRTRVILRILLIIIAAFLLTFFLQYRYFLNDFGQAWQFMTERPLVFYYNVLLMLFIVLFFSSIFKRPFLSIGIVWALLTAITYAHINKFNFRGTPLLPEDFQMASEAGSLLKFIDLWSLVRVIFAIVLIIALAILLDHLTKNILQTKRQQLLPRLLIAAVSIFGLVFCTEFARNHSDKSTNNISWLNSEFIAWNQTANYDHNGFLIGFAYNLGKFQLSAPDGYSEQVIQEIATEYNNKKADDASRTILSTSDYNIVVVLNESFYDPELLKDYYTYEGGDVTPNLHKIMSENPSGRMYSPDYGGGTANIEFEAITGLTNYWASAVPYTDLLPNVKSIPSLASFAKKNGYHTVAIHPFNGGMYKRNLILPKEGFDEFISQSEMHHTETNGGFDYINDRSSYNEVLDLLNQHNEKQMILLITMQNHAPYNQGVDTPRDFTVAGDYKTAASDFTTYLQMLHSSDTYLGEFIDNLSKSNEKTIVLFFGDHAPGIFPEVIESAESNYLAHLTPYFIYTNFDLPKDKATGAMRLVTTTPNCLTNTTFNLLNLEKPTLGYLLDEVCSETPILTPAFLGAEAPEKTTALTNYEMINYDVMSGNNYWQADTNN